MTQNTETKQLTLKRASEIVTALGCSIKKVNGEYQVKLPGGTYFTDDIDDAVGTARLAAGQKRYRAYHSQGRQLMAKTIVTNLDPLDSTAAAVICPTCGHLNEIKWNGNHLEWWPTADKCSHYVGSYSTGDPKTAEVRFH